MSVGSFVPFPSGSDRNLPHFAQHHFEPAHAGIAEAVARNHAMVQALGLGGAGDVFHVGDMMGEGRQRSLDDIFSQDELLAGTHVPERTGAPLTPLEGSWLAPLTLPLPVRPGHSHNFAQPGSLPTPGDSRHPANSRGNSN